MTESNKSHAILQLVRPHEGSRVPSHSRSFVAYRDPSGCVSRRPRFGASLFRSGHSVWLVAPTERVQLGPKLIPVRLGAQPPFRCAVTCSVRSLSEGERSLERLLDVVTDSTSPDDGFWRWISDRLHELGDRTDWNAEPVSTVSIRMELERAAFDELGISSTIDLSIEDGVRTLELNPPAFPVHVRGSEERLEFRFEMSLETLAKRPDEVMFQRAASADAVQVAVIEKIKAVLKESCSMEQFMLHPADVSALLREHGVHKTVEPLGFRVTSLRAYPSAPLEVDLPSVVKHTVTSSVQPDNTEIQVNHQLRLTLNKPEVLLRRQDELQLVDFTHERIENWVKEVLNDVTETALIGLVYIDLLMDFESTRREIEAQAEERFGSFGFSVHQHITKECLPLQNVVERGFHLSWRDGQFSTSDGRVTFSLHGSVAGKGLERDRVRNLLRPDWKYGEEIEAACRTAIASVARRLRPETLYLKFDATGSLADDAEELGLTQEEADRRTPRQLIEAAAGKALELQFGVLDATVRLTQAEDDFATRFDELLRGPNREIELSVTPHADAMEQTPYRVWYRVTALSDGGWSSFQRSIVRGVSAAAHIEQIGATLKAPALAALKTLEISAVNFQSFQTSRKIRDLVFREGIQHVRDFFGLEVKVLSIDRGPSVADGAQGVIKRQAVREEIENVAELRQMNQQALRELMEKEKEVLLGGTGIPGDEEELEFTRREINRVRATLAPFQQTGSSLIDAPAEGADKPTKIDDLRLLSSDGQSETSAEPLSDGAAADKASDAAEIVLDEHEGDE